ncbi:MAG TPA: class I SAM-dependent methyltransferase [Paracoccaceae bacterium]|nr:class I SAM-dependent methyltransferase [Paracoccaceae bacterium]
MAIFPWLSLALNVVLLAGLVLLYRMTKIQFDRVKHITRVEVKRLEQELERSVGNERKALREDFGKLRERLNREIGRPGRETAKVVESVKRMLVTSTQQIEWRAVLCERLGWSFGRIPATRNWAASPDFLVELVEQVQARRPKVIVECGSGVSTLVLARALELNGEGAVWSLDETAEFGALTRRRLEALGLGAHAHVIVAEPRPLGEDLADQWYDLAALEALPETIDLLVVDGPQQSLGRHGRRPAIDHLFPRLGPGGAAIFDDANREIERGFPHYVAENFPGWEARKLPCEKGAWLFTFGGAEAG